VAVAEVSRRERLDLDQSRLSLGRIGTYPTLIVDGRAVVKLYGPWWSGPESFAAEADAYDLLASDETLPVPRRIAQGGLAGDEWRYLVLTFVPGIPLADAAGQLTHEALLELASWLGWVVLRLHALPVRPGRVLRRSWEPFAAFITRQRSEATARHRRWNTLPAHLVGQLDEWLPTAEALLDRSRAPVMVHGDLHENHLLGFVDRDRFVPTGVIDFTDVMVGDPYYELGPIQRSTFRCDRTLLAKFLLAARLPPAARMAFERRALAFALLHDFDQLRGLTWLGDVADLDELAVRLFGSRNLD
jgi:hygromycin-B 7''-O-kinase